MPSSSIIGLYKHAAMTPTSISHLFTIEPSKIGSLNRTLRRGISGQYLNGDKKNRDTLGLLKERCSSCSHEVIKKGSPNYCHSRSSPIFVKFE